MAAQGSCNVLNSNGDEEDNDESRLEEEEESYGGEGVARETSKTDDRFGRGGGEFRMDDELEDFRRQWKCEINNQSLSGGVQASPLRRRGGPKAPRKEDLLNSHEDDSNNNSSVNINNSNIRDGVCAEELRKALSNLKVDRDSHENSQCEGSNDDDEEEDDDCEDEGDTNSIARSQTNSKEVADKRSHMDTEEGEEVGGKMVRVASDSVVCRPEFCQGGTHMSDLPLEVLNLIFKWVVSSHLDVSSLERLSMVCKSFYLLARDEDLWKAICMRTWEKSSLPPCYSSYRQMFIERPRVMFNGCYISRVTYFRQGEKSFDGFYRPFHMVKYYRYIRFYPEGKVYMFMSPEQPKKAVSYLGSRSNYVQGLQYGYYKFSEDKVSLVLKKIPEPSLKSKRFVKNSCHYADHEQTFFLEMSLKAARRRRNCRLSWLKYFMHRVNKSSDESSTMTFNISADMYPPFYFYPVKSFAAQSEMPL